MNSLVEALGWAVLTSLWPAASMQRPWAGDLCRGVSRGSAGPHSRRRDKLRQAWWCLGPIPAVPSGRLGSVGQPWPTLSLLQSP